MEYESADPSFWVPLIDIYVDPKFNCRGEFSAQDVISLAQSIKENGQWVPVLIQPMGDVPEDERPDPCPWAFRMVGGHRRYMSIDIWTDRTHIKACVQEGLTKEQAKVLNYIENLERKDLNLLQQAKGLQGSWAGQTVKQIASLIKKPKRWVQVRLNLLDLPEYVQKKAATGQLSQYDIESLAKLEYDQVEKAFQGLLTTKGKKGRLPVVKGRQPWRNRPRGKQEIERMIGFLQLNQRFSSLRDRERDLITSTLAWVCKRINGQEFLENRLDFPDGCVIFDKDDKATRFKQR